MVYLKVIAKDIRPTEGFSKSMAPLYAFQSRIFAHKNLEMLWSIFGNTSG